MSLTGVILGSGLNKFSEEIENSEILLEDNSGFHKRRIIKGTINKKPIIVFEGRKHFYEGYSPLEVFMNVNTGIDYKIKNLIISNAAGGVNLNYNVADLMLITSHIDLMNRKFFQPNQLCYNQEQSKKILELARGKNLKLRKGTYAALSGPCYETQSEISMLRKIGADAIGMSTIPEILYAKKNNINVIGISCITNLLRLSPKGKTDHAEVVEAGLSAYNNFSKLIKTIVTEL